MFAKAISRLAIRNIMKQEVKKGLKELKQLHIEEMKEMLYRFALMNFKDKKEANMVVHVHLNYLKHL